MVKTNCAVLIVNGSVTLQDCWISLASVKAKAVGVMAMRGNVQVISCEIKGSDDEDTLGVFIEDADFLMTASQVAKHRSGGIILHSNSRSRATISNTTIQSNSLFGLEISGESCTPLIHQCLFSHNSGTALKIRHRSCPQIRENQIKYNEMGICVSNADPVIIGNIIRYNFGDGVQLLEECSARLEANQIYENENGVLCSGRLCQPVIEGNLQIAHNRMVGVKVEGAAFPILLSNEIFENVRQGVLIVHNSNGKIEKNHIYRNLRANIAFGAGEISIVGNTIALGRCEGIFILDSSHPLIAGNDISQNNDGILAINSTPEITENEIHDNRRAGVILTGASEATVSGNHIRNNTLVGLLVREQSKLTALNNEFIGGETPISCMAKDGVDPGRVRADNVIVGEAQLPLGRCSLI
jgi:parallel beta-helix repeat protein